MSAHTIDYAALAKQAGAINSTPAPGANGPVDYAALAKQAGATSSAPAAAPASQPGPLSRAASAFDEWTAGTDNPSEALQGLKMAVQHPSLEGQSLLEMGKNVYRGMSDTWNRAAGEWNTPGVMNKVNAGIHAVESGVPILGPALAGIDQELGQGKYPEAIGHGLAVAAPMLAGSPEARGNIAAGVKAAADAVPSPRGMFAKRMNATSSTEKFTPQERYQAAQEHGVNLDLADATEAGPAQMAKKVASRSLGGSKTFANTQDANLGALNQWGTEYLDKLSPNSGEAAGSRVQSALQSDLDMKTAREGKIYNDLDQNHALTKPDTTPIRQTAQQIIAEEGGYYAKHPEELPKKVWDKVQAAAEGPPKPQLPKGQAGPAPETPSDTWGDIHKLRTDLMNAYRSPDVVGTRAEGFLKRLVGAADQVLTNPDLSNMTDQDVARFRQANDIHANIKETYDNPQHPFYHALRTPQASTAPQMMGMKAPELARQVKDALGPVAGDFQRSVVERILGRDATGAGYDYKGTPGRLRQYPPEYLNELLGPEASTELYKMARVGKTLHDNPNPSGTSAVAIPAAEAGAIGASALHGNLLPAAAPPIEYGVSRFMNSPKVVDYLTQPAKKSSTSSAPAKPPRGRFATAMAANQNQR